MYFLEYQVHFYNGQARRVYTTNILRKKLYWYIQFIYINIILQTTTMEIDLQQVFIIHKLN